MSMTYLPSGCLERFFKVVHECENGAVLLLHLAHQEVQEGHPWPVGLGLDQLVEGRHLETHRIARIPSLQYISKGKGAGL